MLSFCLKKEGIEFMIKNVLTKGVISSTALLIFTSPAITFASENNSVPASSSSVDTSPMYTSNQATMSSSEFDAKSAEERAQLPLEQQQDINKLENYLINKSHQSRSILPFFDSAIQGVASYIFDNIFKSEAIDNSEPQNDWYLGLSNKKDIYMDVFEISTNKNIKLYAKYVDNKSNKTIILYDGFNGNSNYLLDRAKFYSDNGYNLLMPDPRASGKSEGTYITFGAYEKDDLNKWIDLELKNRPNQEIILYGQSMGAASVMLSQETTNEHVKAIIEEGGFSSVDSLIRSIVYEQVLKQLQYIPGYNLIDWSANGTVTLVLNFLNENYLKPKLKFDLYTIQPIENVRKSNTPKLFIHGGSDSVIPIIEKDKLFAAASGYKEQLTIPNANHTDSFTVDSEIYTKKVLSFLNTVDQNLIPKEAVIAPDKNLLKNPDFEETESGLKLWETSLDGVLFNNSILERNNYGEFVMKSSGEDQVTIRNYKNGFRLFNRYKWDKGYVGQEIDVVKGEQYQLSFKANNGSNDGLSAPNVLYGIGNDLNDEAQWSSVPTLKTFKYVANSNEKIKVKLGAKDGYDTFFKQYTHAVFSDIQLINTDHTPPVAPEISEVLNQNQRTIIKGKGEPDTQILLYNNEEISSVKTDANGLFEFDIPINNVSQILHLVNKDVKGNMSKSTVIVPN